MGFRFFRRIRIAPGLTLNLTKRGASLSLGPRGAKYTVGTRGGRATVGIPGTGIFYTQSLSSGKSKRRAGRTQTEATSPVTELVPPQQRLTIGFFQKLFTPEKERAFVDGCREFVLGEKRKAYLHLKKAMHLADGAFMAGLVAIKLSEFENAALHLEQALSKSATLGKTFAKFGLELTMHLPITDEIMALLKPDRRGVLLALVEVYQQLKRYKQAARCLQQLRRLEPDDPVIKLSLAELIYRIEPNNKAYCKKIVELADGIENNTPIETTLLLYKARALHRLGLLEAAKDILSTIVRKTRNRPRDLMLAIRYELALVYDRLGRKKLARSQLEKIYAQSPDYEDVARRLSL